MILISPVPFIMLVNVIGSLVTATWINRRDTGNGTSISGLLSQLGNLFSTIPSLSRQGRRDPDPMRVKGG